MFGIASLSPGPKQALTLKNASRKWYAVIAVDFTVNTKNCEIKEKDSAPNNCKPLQTASGTVLEMGPGSCPPGGRTLKER